MYWVHTGRYLRGKVCTSGWYILVLEAKSMYRVHTPIRRYIVVPYYSIVCTKYTGIPVCTRYILVQTVTIPDGLPLRLRPWLSLWQWVKNHRKWNSVSDSETHRTLNLHDSGSKPESGLIRLHAHQLELYESLARNFIGKVHIRHIETRECIFDILRSWLHIVHIAHIILHILHIDHIKQCICSKLHIGYIVWHIEHII